MQNPPKTTLDEIITPDEIVKQHPDKFKGCKKICVNCL